MGSFWWVSINIRFNLVLYFLMKKKNQVVPSGVVETDEEKNFTHCSWVFTRYRGCIERCE